MNIITSTEISKNPMCDTSSVPVFHFLKYGSTLPHFLYVVINPATLPGLSFARVLDPVVVRSSSIYTYSYMSQS
jgi:hypothetical protein